MVNDDDGIMMVAVMMMIQMTMMMIIMYYLPWHHTDVKNGMVAFGEVGDHKEVFVLVS